MVWFGVTMGAIVIAALFGVAITTDRNEVLSRNLEECRRNEERFSRELNRRSIAASLSAQTAFEYKEEVKRLESVLREKNREIIKLRTEAKRNVNV